MDLEFIDLTDDQKDMIVTTITPWLSALKSPLPNLSIPYGLPVWILTLTTNSATSYLVSQTLTNPYSMVMVNSDDSAAVFSYINTDSAQPSSVAIDTPVVQNLATAVNYAGNLPYNIVVHPRFLIIPGQFKFLWLYEFGKVLPIEKSIANVGTFLTPNILYRYSDMVQMITSNLLGLGI